MSLDVSLAECVNGFTVRLAFSLSAEALSREQGSSAARQSAEADPAEAQQEVVDAVLALAHRLLPTLRVQLQAVLLETEATRLELLAKAE